MHILNAMNNQTIKAYLASINKYPLLNEAEEKDLSVKIQKGDKASLTKLINSNLKLVVSIATKICKDSEFLMDLIQEGNMGLMVAGGKFSHTFQTRFSTYAYPWITQYILRYIDNHSSLISIPHRKEMMIKKIQNAQAYFFQQNGREATVSELSLFTGIEMDKIISTMDYSYTMASLDVKAGDDANSCTIGDLISDTTYSPENLLVTKETKKIVHELMDSLPGNEKKVLWYRYNFDEEMSGKTLREVSKIIGVSPEAVRQTEMRALKRLEKAARKTV